MLELPHAVIGATIAAKVGNPALALPLALASHFVLDMVPHWNPHLNTELREKGKISKKSTLIIFLDVLLSIISVAYISSQFLPNQEKFYYILLGGFIGILPDVLEAPYFFLNWKYPYVDKLLKFQKSIQNDVPVFWGLATQVIIVATAFWWLLIRD